MIEVIPSLDLSSGEVVRLTRGNRDDRTVYSSDPLGVARGFISAGAKRLHIVDLDGAFTGHPGNREVVRRLAGELDARVQVGGGIRSVDQADAWISEGADRVVLGTLALTDPEALFDLVDRHGDRIVVALDVLRGQACIEGWVRGAQRSIAEAVAQVEAAGVATILYTDIDRDGTLVGPNLAAIVAVSQLTRMRILAAGGIASPQDLARLQALERSGVSGAIVGKALYEGCFTYEQAMRVVRSAATEEARRAEFDATHS